MSKHALDTNVAKEYGVNVALLLENFQFWILKNLQRGKHIHDGLCWTYDTLQALGEAFPYWTKRQIEHTINNAVREGLIIKGNYNQTQYDRTLWYALTPKAYAYYPDLLEEKYLRKLFDSIPQKCEINFAKWRNRFPESVTPIPDTIPDTDPYTKKNNIKKSISDEMQQPENKSFTLSPLEEQKSEKEKSHYLSTAGRPSRSLNLVYDSGNEKNPLENQELGTKPDYKNYQALPKKETLIKSNDHYDVKNILEDNVFKIPEQFIRDWICNRKKKRVGVTRTAWSKINKELQKCVDLQIDPVEAFETMVASGWQSMKAEYFDRKKPQSFQWDIDTVMRA